MNATTLDPNNNSKVELVGTGGEEKLEDLTNPKEKNADGEW